MENIKETRPSRHNRLTPRQIHRDCGSMHRAHTGPSQMRSQCWEGNWTQGPILNAETFSNWQQLTKETIVFSSGFSLGMHTTFNEDLRPAQNKVPGIFGDALTDNTFGGFFFCCFSIMFPILCFYGFCSVCVSVHVCVCTYLNVYSCKHVYVFLMFSLFFLFPCFILDCLLVYWSVCFLKRERKGVELDVWGEGEELGGDGRGETAIRMHCIKIIFNN